MSNEFTLILIMLNHPYFKLIGNDKYKGEIENKIHQNKFTS